MKTRTQNNRSEWSIAGMLLIILLILPLAGIGQDSITYYPAGQKKIVLTPIGKGKYLRTCYYENGNVLSKGKIKNENRYGAWTYYSEGGTLESKGKYKRYLLVIRAKGCRGGGDLHVGKRYVNKTFMKGCWAVYDTSGRKTSEQVYRRGYLRKIIMYRESGVREIQRFKRSDCIAGKQIQEFNSNSF